MNTSVTESPLNIQDMPRVLSTYWRSIAISTLVSAFFCFLLSNQLPKKYKVHFVFTIYSKYFQSPLVGDFLPELSDSSDARSQRESLIRQVFTPDYLDLLGKKFSLYASDKKKSAKSGVGAQLKGLGESLGFLQPSTADSLLSAEREDLRSRIEIDSLNSTTFKVGFIYSDPAVALKVTQDIYDHIIDNLLAIRSRGRSSIRDAIQNRVVSLSDSLGDSSSGAAHTPTGQQSVSDELESVRAQIRKLSAQYTDEHPLLIQMRDREKILVDWQASHAAGSPVNRVVQSEKAPANSGTGEATRDIYGDLNKKLNYLNIAIDSEREHQADYFATLEPPLYPSSALWPKKGLVVLWGMALGFFGALFVSAIREYYHRSTLHAVELARQLNLPLLGELPAFPSKAAR